MTKHAYSYAVLQYRHDVWVGEALNAGVLLFSESARFLKLKTRTGQGRLAQAYPDLDHGAFRDAVKAMGRRFDRIASTSGLFMPSGGALEVGKTVLRPDDSSLSWGMTGSGVAVDPEEALEKLYGRFVGRYDKAAGREPRTDEMVFETVRRKLELAELYQRVQPKLVKSKFGSIQFKHTIENGVLHVIQPVSFDSADADNMLDKAAKWAGRLQSIAELEGQVRPYFVTGRPSDRALMGQYDRMVALLKASPLDPVVMDEGQSGDLVAKIEERLH
ncbi:DUF3037 domain-containing protein [Gemmobacter sp. 24YEA27]|uniref:DUF3037 domain-containing protein n=1 Tax=Gemmobacter sp. 24YEA27 TaxID=3040672 RepID=UPI0024B328F8|nr:DUF3037 domain-containing protein [Gemmobacter sp. 24YEA27]